MQLLSLQSRWRKFVVVGTRGRLDAALPREYWAECGVIGFNYSHLDPARPEQLRSTLGQGILMKFVFIPGDSAKLKMHEASKVTRLLLFGVYTGTFRRA